MISEVDIRDMQPQKRDYPTPYTDLFGVKASPFPPVDVVNHPPHYTNHPSGIECIQITEHMNFLMGNAMKYLWRADLKNGVEDLEKLCGTFNERFGNELKGQHSELHARSNDTK